MSVSAVQRLELQVQPHLERFEDPRLRIKVIEGSVGGAVIGTTIQKKRIDQLREMGVKVLIWTFAGDPWSHPA